METGEGLLNVTKLNEGLKMFSSEVKNSKEGGRQAGRGKVILGPVLGCPTLE